MPERERVIAYIDGFNLYFGLKARGWRRFYWLDLVALARNLLRPRQTLVETKYFTSRIRNDPSKEHRQSTYIDALETLPPADFHIFYGKFQSETRTCRSCGASYQTTTKR